MKWFAVHGRVPKDDDDTVMVLETENGEAARAEFRSAMTSHLSDEAIAALDSQYGSTGGVFIITVLESDTEIRESK